LRPSSLQFPDFIAGGSMKLLPVNPDHVTKSVSGQVQNIKN
jgi:hypothetical protein